MQFDANSVHAATQLATQGSPLVLQAAGRMFGLGEGEQQALLGGKVPAWALLLAGVTIGWVVGSQSQKRRWAPGWLSTK